MYSGGDSQTKIVFYFIKYNARLLAEREKLTSLEKSLIVRDTDPDVIHKFSEEEKDVLAKLKAKYGDFIVDYADLEVEGTDNAERIDIEAFKRAGFVNYYNENPFEEG